MSSQEPTRTPEEKLREGAGDEAEENNPNYEYREMLDKAADEVLNPEAKNPPPKTVHPVVEKGEAALLPASAGVELRKVNVIPVAKYVPESVGKMLGIEKDKTAAEDTAPPPGPPDRPVHDPQIEEFVRDQHRSKPGDIMTAIDS